jgi:CHAT domain-containing protein
MADLETPAGVASRLSEELGPEHPDTLAAKARLAAALRADGDWAGARAVDAQVLEARARLLGPEDPLTLESRTELAADLRGIGDYAGARDADAQVLQARSRLLGPDDALTLKSKANLAEDLRRLGDYAAAREMHSQVLEARERALGADHADTLLTRNNLALTLIDIGEFEAARDILVQVLEARERILGADDPETITTRNNLASAFGNLGDFVAARELQTRVLRDRERILGAYHPDTLKAKSNLAITILNLGELAAARDMFAEALSGMEKSLGSDHPDTLLGMMNLAASIGDLGDQASARDILAQASETAERTIGPRHPISLMLKNNLAEAVSKVGDFAAARDLYGQVIQATEQVMGDHHPLTIEANTNLALTMSHLGEHEAARDLQLQILDTSRRYYGPDHFLTAQAAVGLGQIFLAKGDAEQAVFFLKLAVDATQRARGKLASLDPRIRESFLKSVAYRYHELYAALMKAGRPTGALAVLGLLKDDELRESDPLLAEMLGKDGESDFVDLFTGTPEEDAHRAYEAAARTNTALGAEHAALLEKRAREALTPEEESRFSELNERMRQSSETFLDICDRLPQLLGNGEGRAAARAMLDLQSRQKTLGEMGQGTVLLHAVSTDQTLFLVLLTPHALVTRESAVGREELSALVSGFRALLRNPRADPRPAGARLYDLVVRPLAEELRGAGARTVMLSLDGMLRYIPLAALWDGEKWLAESYPTSIFTESSVDKLRSGPPELSATGRALGVTAAHPPFRALPGVAEEIVGIVRVDGSAGTGVLEGQAHLDGDFTREALSRGLASGVPVVHVASHFKLDPASHKNTVLLLGDGSTLSLRDIGTGPDLDFKGLDLLTLSACDTASATRRSDGTEIESFGEVVQRLGASAVLASLWPVEDSSTAQLMREFYRLRYREGKDKAQALRGAQLKIMQDTDAVTFLTPRPAAGAGSGAKAASGQPAGATGPAGSAAAEAGGAPVPDGAGDKAASPGPGDAAAPAGDGQAASPAQLADGSGNAAGVVQAAVEKPTGGAGPAAGGDPPASDLPADAAEDRGTGISAAGAAATGTAVSAPRWEGTGYSHPYFWAPFIVMGAWK